MSIRNEGGAADRSDPGALPGSVHANESGSLGETLRRARQQRGLTIPQIVATTKIPARFLEALERDDVDATPGGMYLRAEVLAYAEAVGLDRDVALDYLHRAIDPPPADGDPPQSTAAPRSRPAAGWSVVLAGICLAIVAVGAIVVWLPDRRGQTTASPLQPAPGETMAVSATAGRVEPSPTALTQVTADSPPPSAPSVIEAELEIVTEPAGARVTVDGVGWGITPVTIENLPPGSKRLRITRDGFASEERMIRLAPDRPRTTVQIELRQAD